MKTRFLNRVAYAWLAAVTPAAYANLVTNGSFESGSPTALVKDPGFCSIPGWTCSVPAGNSGGASDNVGLWTASYGASGAFFGADFLPPDNATSPSPDLAENNAVYLVDDGDPLGSPITETISQNIFVTAGHEYNVGLDLFFVALSEENPNTSFISLSINGGAPLFTVSTADLPVGGWVNENALYAASGSGPVLFKITYTGGLYAGEDMLLDRAYAVESIPEPGLFGLLALGLSGLLGIRAWGLGKNSRPL